MSGRLRMIPSTKLCISTRLNKPFIKSKLERSDSVKSRCTMSPDCSNLLQFPVIQIMISPQTHYA